MRENVVIHLLLKELLKNSKGSVRYMKYLTGARKGRSKKHNTAVSEWDQDKPKMARYNSFSLV